MLAWSTIEALKEKYGPAEALPAAAAFLLKLGDSAELRQQVAELYRAAYGDRPGFEALLAESGLTAGRPPRRALRILDVCLGVEPGSYLTGRHEDAVASIESVDTETWRFTVRSGGGVENLSAVELADRYSPADADDIRVLRRFDPDRLRELLDSDPVAVIIGILKSHRGSIDSDTLEHMLSPVPIAESNWSKWWSAARAALKRCPHVRVEGRSPYYLTYVEAGESLEQETMAKFRGLAKPADQLAVIESYLRECRVRKQMPDPALLASIRAAVHKHAEREHRSHAPGELTTRLLIVVIDQARGVSDGSEAVEALLRSVPDAVDLVRQLEVSSLWPLACDLLERVAGEQRREVLARLLPVAPLNACDGIARRLLESGGEPLVLESIVQEIVADPIRCFDGLLWLWDGSDTARRFPAPPPLTLLTRILGVLAEVRRHDAVSAQVSKTLPAKARAALSARKYERFAVCLDEIEPGMAMALRTLIARLDNLGKSVYEDLLTMISRKFPDLYAKPKIPVWQQEHVIYVTREGKARKEAEISELVNVKMKENARAIGEAAARGDLSENSEYKFALEERDLLRARLGQMQDELSKVRVIEPDDIPTDEVGIGSKVTFKDQASARTVALTFLGPWDSALERGIVNYRSPVGQSIMGRHIGDHVELDIGDIKGAFVVDHIESALAPEPQV
jgi:transcription elongation GreA/GreB family factor